MFIYVATNTVNGKKYVGQTTGTPEQRWQEHAAAARRGYDQCPLFYRAIRKYGPESFTLEVFQQPVGTTQLELDEAERRLIAELNAQKPHGYNLRSGGYGGKLHPDTCAKLSASKKGRVRPHWERLKISAAKKGKPNGTKGIPKQPEHRAKIGAANRGRVVSTETRAKLSAINKGRTSPPKSDATRLRLSQAMKAFWADPQRKAERSRSMVGKNGHPMTAAQKTKLIAINTGRYWSPEDRARQSAQLAQRWAARKAIGAKSL